MSHCSLCGAAIPDDLDACPQCGGSRDSEPSEDFHTEPAEDRVPQRSDCMTRLEIAELACKILAVWIFAKAALSIGPLLTFLFTVVFGQVPSGGFSSLAYSAMIPLGELIVGGLLWISSSALARQMVWDDPTPVVRTDLNREQWMSIAFSVVGIYAVWASSDALFRYVGRLFFIVRQFGADYANLWLELDSHGNIVGLLGSLAFGLWLLFGSRGIVRIVQRVRGEGSYDREATADNSDAP